MFPNANACELGNTYSLPRIKCFPKAKLDHWETLMSKGPGKVQCAVRQLLISNPDSAFTIEDICRRVYAIETVEKKHKVAVYRAIYKMKSPDGQAWSFDWEKARYSWHQRHVLWNFFSVESYLATLRLSWWWKEADAPKRRSQHEDRIALHIAKRDGTAIALEVTVREEARAIEQADNQRLANAIAAGLRR